MHSYRMDALLIYTVAILNLVGFRRSRLEFQTLICDAVVKPVALFLGVTCLVL